MTILDVTNYSKSFTIHHLNRRIPVFEGIDFSLQAGEFLLIRGPNGVGKSTLLRCLFRSYRPTTGEALYHRPQGTIDLAAAADVDMALLRRHELGFVTQFLRPRPRVTALELVAEPLLMAGLSAADAEESAAEMLESFGLKRELWAAYPTTFSGGEQQKVNLARALIRPRRLLLLDEPTASLDKPTREALHRRLQALKDQNVAMIAVLHHPEDVAGLVDDELYLNPPAGVVIDETVREEIMSNE